MSASALELQQKLFQQQEQNVALMLQVQEQRQVLDTLRVVLTVNQNNYIVPAVSHIQKSLKRQEQEIINLRQQVISKSLVQTQAMGDLQKSVTEKPQKTKQSAADFNLELEKMNATRAINRQEALKTKIEKLKEQLKVQKFHNQQLLAQNNQLKNLLVEAVNSEADKKTDLTEEQLDQFLQLYKKSEQENTVLKSQITEMTQSQMRASGDASLSELEQTRHSIQNDQINQKDAVIAELKEANEQMRAHYDHIIELKAQRINQLEALVKDLSAAP